MPPAPDAPRAEPPPPAEAPGGGTRVPLGQRVRAYRLLLTLAAITLAADQATKLWIVARVPYNPMHAHGLGHDIEIIRGFFYIIHVGNTGAAWSMFAGRGVVLAGLAVATLIAIYFWRHSLGLRDRLSQVAFGLLCGGIVGNLIDRLLHQHVIDFIDLHFGHYVYPTFNIADSGICVGVILYLWQTLRAPAPPTAAP